MNNKQDYFKKAELNESKHTGERVTNNVIDSYVLQRSLKVYNETAKRISGDLLEIGSGTAYATGMLAQHVTNLVIIDKFRPYEVVLQQSPNICFKQMVVPPLTGINSNSFDFVISFQVIEHIKRDDLFLEEIVRVLKPGGIFFVSTPNIETTLARNPYHVREYTLNQFKRLLSSRFEVIESLGIYGDNGVNEYYKANKEAIQRIRRFDPFGLEHRLPGWMLRIPFDILNTLNRRRLMKCNSNFIKTVSQESFFIKEADEYALDFFFIARKPL